MKTTLYYIIFTTYLAIIALAIAACEGPEGPVGPQGTQGEQGEQGPQGNANVMSGNFTLTNEDYENSYWSLKSGTRSTYGIFAKIAEVSIPAITDSIFNTGTVLVYLKVPAGFSVEVSQWTPLPFMLRAFSVGYFNSIKYAYDAGVIHIAYLYEKSDPDADMPNLRDATVPDYEFKYVVIEGTLDSQINAAGVDLDDFDEVQTFFRVRDIPMERGIFRISTP